MAAWRNLSILVVVLALTPGAGAQTFSLTESVQTGDCFQYKLAMKLAGTWQVQRDDDRVAIELSATAGHDYVERVLSVSNGTPVKTARWYHQARAAIITGKQATDRTLRPDRRLVVAQRHKDTLYTYTPEGPLTRGEMETLEHLETLQITGLLPKEAVTVGATWKFPNPVVQALCAFDGLIEHDLVCKLESVTAEQARIVVSGTASGINVGALAKLTVNATATFDLKAKRLTTLEWKQKDERDQGPASPATTVDVSWTVTRAALDQEPNELNDYALVNAKVPDGDDAPPESFLKLLCQDSNDRFQVTYPRDWQTSSQTAEHVILRLMDRGDWVAQATITPWTKADAGKHMSADEFREKIDELPGWEADEVLEDGELKTRDGHWGWRVSALGEMDGLKVLQNFYIVAGPDGDQVVVMVTLRPALAQKLGTRDLELVDGISFVKPK